MWQFYPLNQSFYVFCIFSYFGELISAIFSVITFSFSFSFFYSNELSFSLSRSLCARFWRIDPASFYYTFCGLSPKGIRFLLFSISLTNSYFSIYWWSLLSGSMNFNSSLSFSSSLSDWFGLSSLSTWRSFSQLSFLSNDFELSYSS